jgi:hypothetical protein
VLLADRGFADTDLMRHLQRLGWHWRIRIKSNFWIYRPGRAGCQPNRLGLAPGYLALPGEPDPEPAIASRKQLMSYRGPCFSVEFAMRNKTCQSISMKWSKSIISTPRRS